MARGRKKRNRIRAKRFETEIITTCDQVFEGLKVNSEPEDPRFQAVKTAVGKLIKRLLDQKLLREQEFYVGDKIDVVKGYARKEYNFNPQTGKKAKPSILEFEVPKSWLNKKLSGASDSQIENLINILEEKSIWQKYGF